MMKDICVDFFVEAGNEYLMDAEIIILLKKRGYKIDNEASDDIVSKINGIDILYSVLINDEYTEQEREILYENFKRIDPECDFKYRTEIKEAFNDRESCKKIFDEIVEETIKYMIEVRGYKEFREIFNECVLADK